MWDEDAVIIRGGCLNQIELHLHFAAWIFAYFEWKNVAALWLVSYSLFMCCFFFFPSFLDGRVISPDDFHWHSHGGRAMGHAVDLQSCSFSHGKILLGSYMKKPSHVDHDMVSVSRKCIFFISVNCISAIVSCSCLRL